MMKYCKDCIFSKNKNSFYCDEAKKVVHRNKIACDSFAKTTMEILGENTNKNINKNMKDTISAMDDMMNAMRGDNKDEISNPKHYTQGEIECIEVLEQLNLDFRLSNVIKYVWRHKDKNGIEDLKKAKWYLDRYIKKPNSNYK